MKKIIFLTLAGLIIGSIGTAFALSQLFSDVPENEWYANAINSLSEKEIVVGYEDGTFRPANNINRAELAVILDRLLEHERVMENQCNKLSAYTAYNWYETLNQKYTDEFLTPLEIAGDITGEYGKGCLVSGDGLLIFMPGQTVFGCHEIYKFDTHNDTVEKANSDDFYCANMFTDITEDYVSFVGAEAEGGICRSYEGKYYFEENEIEFTENDC